MSRNKRTKHGEAARFEITGEALGYIEAFPEELVLRALANGPVDISKINNPIGIAWAKRNGWIDIVGGSARLTDEGKRQAGAGRYACREVLNMLHSGAAGAARAMRDKREVVETLEKRGLVIMGTGGWARYAAAERDGSAGAHEIAQLSRELIMSGGWRGARFKRYEIMAKPERAYAAREHPLHEFIDRLRSIWISMGFAEVEGPVVEPAFWNFDALMTPQDHPARDAHDTFTLENPRTVEVGERALIRRVRGMHRAVWREPWSEELALQAVLRTHATATTIRHVHRRASIETGQPIKLFSIGRTFRNEAIDYKHLAEFHQIDGVIIGDGLSLANLAWVLRSYYAALGLEVRMRPSYFPFVAPGLEVLCEEERRGGTVELGGAGIIRREICDALGTSKRVLAWGLSVERLAMRFLGLESVTHLYENDVGWLRERPALRV